MAFNNASQNGTGIHENWVPMALQFVFGLVGNILALVLLKLSSSQHRWRSFYQLYTGLVISDLSIWLLTTPLSIARYATHFTWNFPPIICRYDSFMLMFALTSSAFIIGAMTVDRFLAMARPNDSATSSSCVYVVILLGIWVLAGLLSAVHLTMHLTKNFYPGSWCYMDYVNLTESKSGTLHAYFYSIVGLSVVFIIATINLLMLFTVVFNKTLRARLMDTNRISGGYDAHSYVFLATVALVFSSLWTPHLVVILEHAAWRRQSQGDLELTSIRLVLTNSIINPWLYVVLRKENINRLFSCITRLRNCLCLRSVDREVQQNIMFPEYDEDLMF